MFLQGLQLVDVRTQLMAVDGMREGAADDYALLRDAWMQRRNYQIFGDRQLEGDEKLARLPAGRGQPDRADRRDAGHADGPAVGRVSTRRIRNAPS